MQETLTYQLPKRVWEEIFEALFKVIIRSLYLLYKYHYMYFTVLHISLCGDHYFNNYKTRLPVIPGYCE